MFLYVLPTETILSVKQKIAQQLNNFLTTPQIAHPDHLEYLTAEHIELRCSNDVILEDHRLVADYNPYNLSRDKVTYLYKDKYGVVESQDIGRALSSSI